MRIGVLVFLLAEQVTAFREDLDDAPVRFENVHADKLVQADLCREKPLVIDGREHAQAVLLAGHVVVRAVAGGDVDGAGSGFRGDEICEDHLRAAVEERVARLGAFEFLAFDFRERFGERESGFFRERFDEFADDHVGFAVGKFPDDVGEFGMQGDAEVGGESPRRGGPDDHGGLAGEFTGDEGKFHEHRGRDLVGVFHLRLGERGLRAV